MADSEDPNSHERPEYNPGELRAAEQFPSGPQSAKKEEGSGGQDRSAASGDSGTKGASGANTKNIDYAKGQEEAPYADKTTAGGGGRGKHRKTLSARIFGRIAKKGPLGAIIAALSIGGISFLARQVYYPSSLNLLQKTFTAMYHELLTITTKQL